MGNGTPFSSCSGHLRQPFRKVYTRKCLLMWEWKNEKCTSVTGTGGWSMNTRPPVTGTFLESVFLDLEYFEEFDAPPWIWRAMKALSSDLRAEMEWMMEVREKEEAT